jgi:eukaryotic-like serine/threonine-protein kinase
VHRDLKPANVMVGSFGEVLVLDWGLAKALGTSHPGAEAPGRPPIAPAPSAEARTEAGAIVGTPGYMSPEQERAAGEVDARADVYALGAVLVTILTGQPPPPSIEAVGASLKQRRVPSRLRAICVKAMNRMPDARYADAAALAEDVSRFRAGMPVSAHRETALERAWRFAVRYRTPILLVLAYLVMRTLVAIYVSYTR